MPPAAIFESVVSTICRGTASPVLSHRRSRNSRFIEGGNFGAWPKPPFTRSKRAAIASAAEPRTPVATAPAPESPAASVRCDSSSAAEPSSCSRLFRHAPAIEVSSVAKPGRPYRSSGG
jgi:hypothetical protein